MTDTPPDMQAPDTAVAPPVIKGVACIRTYLPRLPERPGVYRMIDARGEVLYVGKARALKRRVASYTHFHRLPLRLKRMVAATTSMEFIETETELEALLLEVNLIKSIQPRYNILLKDDKMYPYLVITKGHEFPRLVKHRGARGKDGEYFGPFASGGAVYKTLTALQKAFQLRNCSDAAFAARTRPCLQYHIKRCTAPCVAKVDAPTYAAQVRQVRDFLSGKSGDIQSALAAQMEDASERLDYETAAQLRDKIRALSVIQSHQIINVPGIETADVLGIAQEGAVVCVQVFFYRNGQNFGNRAYFPRMPEGAGREEALSAFLVQFYSQHPVPPDILLSDAVINQPLIEDALTQMAEGKRRVRLHRPQRGARAGVVSFAADNARQALARRLSERAADRALLEGVRDLFGLDDTPERIEVYDNSHLGGTNMVGGMIVAGAEGFMKNAYRKFNMRDAGAGDDPGMMREMITRRFKGYDPAGSDDETSGAGESEGDDFVMPDLMLIDGGDIQRNAVLDVLASIGLRDSVAVVGIAKGVDRNAGRETFHADGREPFQLPMNDPVLHYLQRLRDEAHRFAIGAQRARRTRGLDQSSLDSVPGIGARRKKALLSHFGSAKAVMDASLNDLLLVPGISQATARQIHDFFRKG